MNFGVFLYGKNAECRITNNQFLYPRGCNLTAGGGGGQCLYASGFTDKLLLENNLFDGATTGNVTGNTNPLPVDGFNLTDALNTIIKGNTLKNFDFEGLLCGRQLIYASSIGAFSVPAIGTNFTFDFYPNHSTAGWVAGDKFYFVTPGTPTPITLANQMEVVTVVNNTRLTAKLISGSPFTVTDEMWIVHQKYWLDSSSARIANNLFTNTATIPTTGAHAAITCSAISQCYIVENTVADGFGAVYILEPIANGLKAQATITDNHFTVENAGISVSIGCLPCTISRNTITLTGTSHTGGDVITGIQNFANNSILTNNIVSMAVATANEGIGVNLRSNVNGVTIDNNTFKDLDTDVNNAGFVNISHSYINNTLINIAHPQTRFP
jgi:hypothetical protein